MTGGRETGAFPRCYRRRSGQEAIMARAAASDPGTHLPSGAARLATRHPNVWQAFAALGEQCATEGPLDAKARRLAKLALAIGAGSEGAVHSHVRRGLSEGITAAELHHVALLAVPLIGLAAAVKAMTWIDDLAEPGR
jgi:alkylhydroperoxidase/carboxymuconolactone decarboxylase family protein YurZ